MITDFKATYINPEQLECEYKGSTTPIFQWYDGDTIINEEDAAFSIVDTTVYGDGTTAVQTLTIDKGEISDVKTIKCKVTFTDQSDPLETSTKVHFRGA